MNRSIRTAASLAAMMLIAAACNGGAAQVASETSTASPIASVTPSQTPEPTPLPFTAPLTGIGRETEASERPIAVLINNYAAARPQSGLTGADVVWEVLAEGGITRLVAIYQSTEALTDTIGPIRSNRAYLIDIADSYGAVMAHAGGSPEAYGILQSQGKPYLDEITNAGTYFWRSKDRKAPHNLYSDLEKLRTGAEKRNYSNDLPVQKYTFSEEGAVGGGAAAGVEPADQITITFLTQSYKVGYIYDEAEGLYKRTIGGEPHIDLNNSEQLTATNLVVFETSHRTLDDVGRLAVDLQSGGAAYLFQQGKKIDIEWVRAPDDMIRFVRDGAEVPFLPGQTYIHVVPNKPALAEHVTWGNNENENAVDTNG